MALNNNKELHKKRIKQILLFGFLFCLFVFNVVTYCRYILSNPQELINYQKPTDELKYFRNPLIGVSFYDKTGNSKIVVLPDDITDNPNVKKHKIRFDNENIVVINNELTQEKHIQFLLNFSKNITKENFLSPKTINEKNVLIWFDNIENPLPDFMKIKQIIKEKSLKPKFFDLLNYKQIKKISQNNEHRANLSIEQQFENLTDFVQMCNSELKKLILNYKNNQVNDQHFNDKAATMVLACDEKQNCKHFADFDFDKSLVQSLKHNLTKADKNLPNSQKRIFLLTKVEAHSFETQEKFLQNLNKNFGVIIQKGLRTNFLMPDDWQHYKTKEEFVKDLKLKAGLSPDYWSEDINIFYFKAVEVK